MSPKPTYAQALLVGARTRTQTHTHTRPRPALGCTYRRKIWHNKRAESNLVFVTENGQNSSEEGIILFVAKSSLKPELANWRRDRHVSADGRPIGRRSRGGAILPRAITRGTRPLANNLLLARSGSSDDRLIFWMLAAFSGKYGHLPRDASMIGRLSKFSCPSETETKCRLRVDCDLIE